MIEKWVHWIVQVLLQENIIVEQEKEVYVYCFQTMLFQSIVYGTIIILAISSETLLKTVAYYLGLLPIRYTAGGMHTSSHKSCFVLSIAVYLISMVILVLIPETYTQVFGAGCTICAILMVFWAAPVDHKNHIFSPEAKVKYKRQSCLLVSGMAMVFIIMAMYEIEFSTAIALGLFCAGCSLVIGKFERRYKQC